MGLVDQDAASLERWSEFLVSPGLSPALVSALEALTDALQGVEFVLIGGQAVFLHGYQRFSKDLEVGVIVPVEHAEPELRQAGSRAIPVIDLETLLALKVKVGRLRDEADVVELLKAGSSPERQRLGALLRGLGEELDAFERLAERARQELRDEGTRSTWMD